jgi:type I restriction enzyme S subunit
VSTGFVVITCKQDEIAPYFLYHYLSQNSTTEFLHSIAEGSTSAYPSLKPSDIEALEILLPPLDEQNSIASVLSSLDDKIDLLHRQNQTLEQMAETLYDAWFEESDFKSRVSDLIDLQNGYAFKSKSFQDFGEDRVLKIKNISGGIVDIETTDFVSHETVENMDEKFSISTGDILFAMTGAKIGKMGIIPKTDYKLWLNQRVGLFKEKYYGSRFLAYLHLKSDYGKDYIENTATGSAQPNISGTGIENCEFPEISEQEIIDYSNQLAPLYEKVIFNLGQIQKLEALRNTLLPKLMSGEIRIGTDE